VIALLRGTVAAVSPGEVVVDVGGVGYRVRVPAVAGIGAVGSACTLHTHLSVREDALDLYGFPDAAARTLFTTLLTVTGVGPKLALAAISTLGAEGVRRAVVTEDVAALTVIPGVGRKGAQRLILELRERLGALGTGDLVGGSHAAIAADARTEVREALAALGYGAPEVQRAMEALPADGAAEDLLRTALRSLAS
jgi:holliday junction DNA helicase RuvA